jgi:hypothetical protein
VTPKPAAIPAGTPAIEEKHHAPAEFGAMWNFSRAASRSCAPSHTRKIGLQPCGCNLAWSATEPRLLAANRAFIAGEMTYFAWRDEIRACRVALGLEGV